MFSQLRNVVAELAQETTRALENAALESQTEEHSRSQSLDTAVQRSATASSPNHLADSALSSLRKSLVSQRAGTSSTTRRSASPASSEKRFPKSNLEERLRRATSGIVEPLGSSTPNRSPPNRSSTTSPSPISNNHVNNYKKSPPASPAVIAVSEDVSELAPPTELSLQEPPKEPKEGETNGNPDPTPPVEDPTPVPVGDTPPKDKEDGVEVDVDHSNSTSPIEDSPAASGADPPKDEDDHVVVERDSSVDMSPSPVELQPVVQVEECPSAIAEVVPESDDIPLIEEAVASEPKSSEVNLGEVSPKTASVVDHLAEVESLQERLEDANLREAPASSPKTVLAADHLVEVESLQERLRLVEQRFSGTLYPINGVDLKFILYRCLDLFQETTSRKISCRRGPA